MSIAIVGAGAIGGHLGVRLAAAGEDVTFIARGANLETIRARGMRLVEQDGREIAVRPARTTASMAEAGPHDIVLLALKAHQVGPAVDDIRHLIGPATVLVTMQNGLPWWYFQDHGGALAGTHLASIDPGGRIAAAIPPERIVGGVVYSAAALPEPGTVRVGPGNRFVLGEPSGAMTPRLIDVADRLVRAGLQAPLTPDIRAELWLKLWGNLSFNPISALTHATLVDIALFPEARHLAAGMMREAQAVAESLGIRFAMTLDERIAAAERIGAHKTSMLQDVEAGRAVEIEALVGVVMELGRLTGVQTPQIDAVYACLRMLALKLEQAQGRIRIEPR